MRFDPKSVVLNLSVVKRIPWIWAAVGAFIMWVTLGFFAHNLNLESLIATSSYASFLAIAIVVLLSLILTQSRYGKCLTAVGQNVDAARLAGIPVNLVRGLAYVLCSVLAAFGGIMISAQVNGAFLGLGDPYLLQTVGSVVVGGTLISGGRAVPLGTLLGSLFLVLLVTAMQVAGLKVGGQLVAEGLFIIFVLFLATERIRQ